MKMSIIGLCLMLLSFVGCDDLTPQSTADQKQSMQQEQVAQEATAQTGMPAIVHFRERKMFKMIFEMRDQATTTYTYLYSPMTGKLIPFCESIGFPIPYSTQYTNPMRVASSSETPSTGNITIPQADPNALYSPSDSAGTWIMCKDPNSTDVKPVYSEPDLITSPFKLNIN